MATALTLTPGTESGHDTPLELNRVRGMRAAFLSILGLIVCIFGLLEWKVAIRLGPLDTWGSKPLEFGPFIVGLVAGPALFALGLMMYFRISTAVGLRPEGIVVTPLHGPPRLLEWKDPQLSLIVMTETWPRNRDRATLNWGNIRWMPASGVSGESARKLLNEAKNQGLDLSHIGRLPGMQMTRIRSRRKETQ